MSLTVEVARTAPRGIAAIGIPVATSGAVPRSLGWSRAELTAAGFEAKPGQVLTVPSAGGATLVAVGIGPASEVTAAVLRNAAAALARAVPRAESLATSLAEVAGVAPDEAAQAVTEGVRLATYKYLRHKRNENGAPKLARLVLLGRTVVHDALSEGAARGLLVADAVRRVRDLVNEPPGFKNARDLAAVAEEVAREAGLDVEVWDEERIEAERLGGVLAVNRGSFEPPRVVRLHYKPRGRASGKVALVGKGITFDSGGLSLKTGVGMMTMKTDMAGAATVLGVMSVLPALGVRAEVVGYMMCTDNLPSGTAMKPGDVFTSRRGTTVEVLNTDAEGRLVLADGLTLAAEEQPDAIIDVATLTGACIAALGHAIAGVMGNEERWVDQVLEAARRADEQMWPLPLPSDYRKLLDSDVADLKNIGSTNHAGVAGGGALTAGLFLQEFVGDTPWVHLDIAGPSDAPADNGWISKGGTGFALRTLVELLSTYRAPSR